ncbi:MAG TPA: hypothetical protein VKT22_04300, partial [Steroidobacteraceae bacterium]|nr:hypothetical protein [Steroidobacteraceae bacterium]
MAAALIGAVAAHGQIDASRKRSDEREDLARAGLRHLTPVTAGEASPVALGARLQSQRDGGRARSKNRQPDIEKIPFGILGAGHPARRTPHGAESQPLVRRARGAETYNAE